MTAVSEGSAVVSSEPMPSVVSSLSFHVENRAGIMVLVQEDGTVRPASTAEVELWNIVTKRFSNTRESYLRVSEQDLLEVLKERDHMRQQVTALQQRGTELPCHGPGGSQDHYGQAKELLHDLKHRL